MLPCQLPCPELFQQLGYLADHLSVNVELPSERSLNLLCPDKGRSAILTPMGQIAVRTAQSREEMQLISSYVDAKIRSIGREILDGKIAANPYEKGNEEACTYCAYKKVCGFDGSIPGYEKRQLEDLDKQALTQRMQETVEA